MKVQDRYSQLDRLVHRLAFSTIEVQKALADIEDWVYAKCLSGITIDRPVFLTALPRAGTTLLLETLSRLETFVTHTYRNMPFLLIPLLWHTFSHRFRATDTLVTRAHGDGMTIGFDSPEAFEEIVWRAFWPDKYPADRIVTWTAADEDPHEEFEPFITNHVAKLIALRGGHTPDAVRYLSKNNANVSRIPKILQVFPDAVILVPFRRPLDHVASMVRQHRHFQNVHAAEPFTRRYMADVGHFEFGANLRPIDFDHWLSQEDLNLTHTADFWLKYWCAAYAHLLAAPSDNVVLVSYDRLCADPTAVLRCIGNAIGLDHPTDLLSATGQCRAPTDYDPDALNVTRRQLDAASTLHQELLARSVTERVALRHRLNLSTKTPPLYAQGTHASA